MKIRKDKDILQFFAMSLVMILSGVLIVAFFQVKQVQMYGAGIILGGIMLALMGLYVSTKSKDYFIKDERSVRINEKASSHAFGIIILTIGIIQTIDMFWKINILFKEIAPIIFIVGMYSWVILKWYYNKRSEI
ncbi:MAG: DUF2178 domain-containing protein [Candidatus Aenigmarchaeota archaeon]|nr:DUF2178 domain-containing protein [Candidatus Aenigmarchaeota archaeon]